MFTENQSRQLYVVNNVVAANAEVASAGDVKLKQTPDGKEIFFTVVGATDDVQRTDLINKCNVMDIRATAAEDMEHKMKKVEVTLDSNVSATPVVGQDYILNINILGYIANGRDSIKVKFGAAKAYNTVASDLYKALAINLAKNFGIEPVKLIKITLKGDANNTEITKKTKIADLSSITATGIVIEEVEQPWRLGAAKVEYVNFEVQPSTIFINPMDRVWGTVTDVTAANTNTLPNSKIVADMEYFYHKNRGDVYGMIDWPNNIDTKYMVNPSSASGYSMIDIHFYYEGNSHNVGHSEKTITLVGSKTELAKITEAFEDTVFSGYNVTVTKSENWPSE
jgi:hypothetical protein